MTDLIRVAGHKPMPVSGASVHRSVVQAEGLSGVGYMRSVIIEVPDDAGDEVRFGDNWHPGDEPFTVVRGRGKLYVATKEALTDVAVYEFHAGQFIVIPAGIVHTLVCAPGTLLVATPVWPLTDGATIPCELKID